MSRKPRLELTWLGKEQRPQQNGQRLVEDPSKSYRETRSDDACSSQNRLIRGENLAALQLLESDFAGQIKCVYIDPPYNTGSVFAYYDDSLEHSTWLSFMRDRLEVLRRLMRPDGFLCCHIDDSEGHYLKVLLDEVFSRSNYLATLYLQVRYPSKTLKQDMDFHKQIEQVHVYRKDPIAKPNRATRQASFEKFRYSIQEIEPGAETTLGGKRVVVFPKGAYHITEVEGSKLGLKEIWASGTILDGNSSGRFFRDHLSGRTVIDGLGTLYKVFGIGDDRFEHRYFTGPSRPGATKGKYYQGVPRTLLEEAPSNSLTPIENFYDLAGSFGNCRHEGGVEFRSGKKPEALLEVILRHFSDPGDWVLDGFAGSGTTGAVAHKMGRRWIMIESEDHCDTHIIPRLRTIIDGTDPTGVTERVGWPGGGGFRYFTLVEE